MHPEQGHFIHVTGEEAEGTGRPGGGGADKLVLAIASFSQRHVMHGYQLKWEIRGMGAGGLGKDEKA